MIETSLTPLGSQGHPGNATAHFHQQCHHMLLCPHPTVWVTLVGPQLPFKGVREGREAACSWLMATCTSGLGAEGQGGTGSQWGRGNDGGNKGATGGLQGHPRQVALASAGDMVAAPDHCSPGMGSSTEVVAGLYPS